MAIAARRQGLEDIQQLALRGRIRDTVALLEQRGYALPPRLLGKVCLGGPLSEREVLAGLAGEGLHVTSGLVCSESFAPRAAAAARRQAAHPAAAPAYLGETVVFALWVAEALPFVVAVSIAGSLASGGFTVTDDVDLNLVVEDGHRHLAYFALNAAGVIHALRHRGKPVDNLSARPVSPRVMTANLILERSACFPLARTDAAMAFELLASEPIVGAEFLAGVAVANPGLLEHFPQLAGRPAPLAQTIRRRIPAWLFPRWLDAPARWAGRAAWRYLQWTRRHHSDALARVAYVRSTMRPYALFDDSV